MNHRSGAASTVAARQALIEGLRERGITDENVLRAILTVPREEFVPNAFRHRAYEDGALPISCNQTISQPFTVALMSQYLEASEGMSVLEVGTGSGYQAAVLCMMGLRVFSVERHAELLQLARERLDRVKCNVATYLGDGTLGWSSFAPYDRIIVTAGAPTIPPALLKQLAPNGRLVIPIGDRATQQMQLVVRHGDMAEYDVFEFGECKFVPLVGRGGWNGEEAQRERSF